MILWCLPVTEGEVKVHVVQLIRPANGPRPIHLLNWYFALNSTSDFSACISGRSSLVILGGCKAFPEQWMTSGIWQADSVSNICHFPWKQLHLVSESWKLLPVFQAPPLLQVAPFYLTYSFLQCVAQCTASQWSEVTHGVSWGWVWDLVLERELNNKETQLSNNVTSLMLKER